MPAVSIIWATVALCCACNACLHAVHGQMHLLTGSPPVSSFLGLTWVYHLTCTLFTIVFLGGVDWSQSFLPSVLWRCWLGGRKGIRPVKKQWLGAGMVTCLEQGGDLHMAQLMPLPLTVSFFSKIQFGFTFLVPAHLDSPGKRSVKQVCVLGQSFLFLGSPLPPFPKTNIWGLVEQDFFACWISSQPSVPKQWKKLKALMLAMAWLHAAECEALTSWQRSGSIIGLINKVTLHWAWFV